MTPVRASFRSTSRASICTSVPIIFRYRSAQPRALLAKLPGSIHGGTMTSKRFYSAPTWSRMQDTDGQCAKALKEHDAEVEQVAASVRMFRERGEKFRIFHGSTNSTRKSAMGRDPKKTVDTSRLNRVLYVDAGADEPYALVQPNVPMDRLVEETLKYGLVPLVVMEFPGITVGGGYSGTSGESSSFRHGFFNQTLDQVEMVLANGEIVTCSENERQDLFRGAAGAVGTLGVTTLVKLRLHRAMKYVETTYYPISGGMPEAMSKIQEFSGPDSSKFDYVDGIMFSKTHGAIVTGRMTDTPSTDLPVQRFSHAKDPWFYLHVQDRISSFNYSSAVTEAIPLPEYLFRYDRGGFWVGAAAFKYFPGMPFNSWTRWFLDDFLHTRMLYKALHASGQSEQLIVQDLALPYATAKEFVDFTDEKYGIYPLWLCPLKQSPGPTMHPHSERDGGADKQMLNIGLWGLAPPTHKAFLQANRELEQKLLELGGMKWLYAQTYYTEDEFWSQFDRSWYEALREKYGAKGLTNVYEKVKVDLQSEKNAPKTLMQKLVGMYPFSGMYGLAKAIESKEYLKHRKAEWKSWVPRS